MAVVSDTWVTGAICELTCTKGSLQELLLNQLWKGLCRVALEIGKG